MCPGCTWHVVTSRHDCRNVLKMSSCQLGKRLLQGCSKRMDLPICQYVWRESCFPGEVCGKVQRKAGAAKKCTPVHTFGASPWRMYRVHIKGAKGCCPKPVLPNPKVGLLMCLPPSLVVLNERFRLRFSSVEQRSPHPLC